MAQLKAIQDSSNPETESLETIDFEDGTSCFKTPSNGRVGKFPNSGIEFHLRPRTLGDSQKLERAMGGMDQVNKYQTEAGVRMFVICCTRYGSENSCSLSQVYELDEAIDGMYLANVITSFRPTPRR